MNARGLTTLAAPLVAWGLLTSSAEAQTVMDFNGLSTSSSGGVRAGNPLIEDGFRLSLNTGVGFLGMQDGWQNNRGSSNGTTTLYTYVNFGPNTSFTLDSASGNSFALTSIDVAELFNVGDFAYAYGLVTVDVIGTLPDGNIVSTSFTVDGISDGTGGAEDFQTFTFSSAFGSLSEVQFIANSGEPHSYFNFDNITLDGSSNGCDGDTTPPEVIAGEDIVVFEGEDVVLPAPNVSDLCDPNPIQFNDAPAKFPFGETLVTFSALDASGNLGEDTLLVTVLSNQEAIELVAELIEAEHKSLFVSLAVAVISLDRGRPNTALNQLGAFRSQILAQMGKTISPEVTAVILAMIDRIEASILGS